VFPELEDRLIFVLGLLATLAFLTTRPHADMHASAATLHPVAHRALTML
jgi:hypothetical protein